MIEISKIEVKGAKLDRWLPWCDSCQRNVAVYAMCLRSVPQLWLCEECMGELRRKCSNRDPEEI